MRPDDIQGVRGETGELVFVRNASKLVIACYANPPTSILHLTVPLLDRLCLAANDSGQDPAPYVVLIPSEPNA